MWDTTSQKTRTTQPTPSSATSVEAGGVQLAIKGGGSLHALIRKEGSAKGTNARIRSHPHRGQSTAQMSVL